MCDHLLFFCIRRSRFNWKPAVLKHNTEGCLCFKPVCTMLMMIIHLQTDRKQRKPHCGFSLTARVDLTACNWKKTRPPSSGHTAFSSSLVIFNNEVPLSPAKQRTVLQIVISIESKLGLVQDETSNRMHIELNCFGKKCRLI